MSKHSYKHTTGLAGEFLVAGELLRRGIMAAVTYGNAKKADVIAVSNTKVAFLEVKSTSKNKWVIGSELPSDNPSIWVLVYLPEIENDSPEYFILTSAELRNLLMPQHEEFNKKFLAKHGKEFKSKGVVSIKRELLNKSHLGAWSKVIFALDILTSKDRSHQAAI